MNQIKEQFKIAKLLIDELLGKISSKEENELDKWKEKHSKTYNSILNWENYELRKNKLSNINISNEWQIFLATESKKKQKIIRLRVLKYAATIIILLSCASTIYWLSNFNDKNTIPQIAALDIPPGEKKAELILSNGESIQLHPSSMNELKEADGTVISNDSIVLSYKDSEIKDKINNNTILYNTLNIARGGEYFLILQDGTKVWLNSMSSIKYPVKFTEEKRIVELTGEAYFEVAKDKNHPFIVRINDYDINVLGTSFNVSSYTNDNTTTTLVEGSIQISDISGSEKEDRILSANDQFIFDKTDRSFSVHKVDAKAYCSWIEGSFSFENETIENIFIKLERWYDIEVNFTNEKAKKYEYTGKLPRFENFEVILEMLEIISEVQFAVDGNDVSIGIK